jgi:MFS transporter, YQGE family, putative transporter
MSRVGSAVQVNYYLAMNGIFTFAIGLSTIFLNIFLWKLDKSFQLLAIYNLIIALVIIVSFPICSWIARMKDPIFTIRIGFMFYMITYGSTLLFRDNLAEYIVIVSILMGMAISLFAVGSHIAILDMTENATRDKFLYLQGFIASIAGMLAPLIGGFCIEQFNGETGYYIVFSISCLLMIVAIILSYKIHAQPVLRKSQFWKVVKSPNKKWKGMVPIMIADGIFGGAFETFLIAMMTFYILGSELDLGIFQSLSSIVALMASLLLARYSKPTRRFMIYSIGALLLMLISSLLAFLPVFFTLVIFSILYPVGKNMISTTMFSWLYAAIEADPNYKDRRLDYIVMREIPLGLGRVVGIVIFLLLRDFGSVDRVLENSFIVFPLVFVMMIPIVGLNWKHEGKSIEVTIT